MKSGVGSTGVPTERSINPSLYSRARAPYGANKSQGKSGSLISLLASLWKSSNHRVVGISCPYFARAAGRTDGLKERGVDLAVLLPVSRNVIFVINRLNRADRLTRTTINTLIRLDVEHPIPFVNTVNRALLDAGFIFHIDTGLGDYVGHGDPFE